MKESPGTDSDASKSTETKTQPDIQVTNQDDSSKKSTAQPAPENSISKDDVSTPKVDHTKEVITIA